MSGNGSLLSALLAESRGAADSVEAVPRRALVWARVSTDMQEERGLSMPEQLRQLRRYAGEHGIEVVEEYQEAASAFQREEKRVEFHRMTARAKQDPSIDTILVHDMSRFSRDSGRAKVLLGELRRAGVEVVSLSDPAADPDTVAGVYLEAITLARNEAYSREIAFHTRKGCRANVQTRDPETGWCYKNGGQPPWGYRSERISRGLDKRGRPIYKAISVPDDRVVAGRPVHEWARHCLVELAANGASIDALRDFCNSGSLPAPQCRHWGSSTWQSLLQPHKLLQYAGYGVWNVHRKNGMKRAPSDWVVVEGTQEALITENEAIAVARARQQRAATSPGGSHAQRRAGHSRYLLTGGLLVCARCGANMVGARRRDGKGCESDYYVCGTAKYRRGLGCGAGVYLDRVLVEEATIREVECLLDVCTDAKRVTEIVNRRLRDAAHGTTDERRRATDELSRLEAGMANVRLAVQQGLDDIAWANERLRQLKLEHTQCTEVLREPTRPVANAHVSKEQVMAYRHEALRSLNGPSNADRRGLVRQFVTQMDFEPDTRLLTMTLRQVPARLSRELVAGAGFEPAAYGL